MKLIVQDAHCSNTKDKNYSSQNWFIFRIRMLTFSCLTKFLILSKKVFASFRNNLTPAVLFWWSGVTEFHKDIRAILLRNLHAGNVNFEELNLYVLLKTWSVVYNLMKSECVPGVTLSNGDAMYTLSVNKGAVSSVLTIDLPEGKVVNASGGQKSNFSWEEELKE